MATPARPRRAAPRAGAPALAALALAALGPAACATAPAGAPAAARAPAPAGHGARAARLARPANVLDSAALAEMRVTRVEELIAARVPGVLVSPVSGGYAVRVRGPSSVLGGSEPLYVVDGTPVTPRGPGTLAGISPYDVARIEVVKDPAELSLYGVRGGNGVIRITTRRGARTR